MGAVEAVQPLCQRLLFQATRLLLRSAAREPSVQAWILSEGHTLMVWKLDRLGRSVKQLVDLVGQLHQQGVQFKSLTDAIDGNAIWPVLLPC